MEKNPIWHKSPARLISDADTHDFQRIRDHHEGIGIDSPNEFFQAGQFPEGNDRVQDLNFPSRISSLSLEHGHPPVYLVDDFP